MNNIGEFNLDDYEWNQTGESEVTDDELNLISPNPDENLGPLIVVPESEFENEEKSSENSGVDCVLILGVGITGVVCVVALIIYKKRK